MRGIDTLTRVANFPTNPPHFLAGAVRRGALDCLSEDEAPSDTGPAHGLTPRDGGRGWSHNCYFVFLLTRNLEAGADATAAAAAGLDGERRARVSRTDSFRGRDRGWDMTVSNFVGIQAPATARLVPQSSTSPQKQAVAEVAA